MKMNSPLSKALFATLALALVATACRTNELPKYLPKSETVKVIQVKSPGPTVAIGASDQPDLLVAIVTDVGTLGAQADAYHKIEAAAPPEILERELEAVFAEGLPKQLDLELVDDDPDTRLEIRIERYGITADSPESALFFFMDVSARMIYVPENKLIWEYDDVITEPLNDIHVYSDAPVIKAFATGVNMGTLSKLQPAELEEVFVTLVNVAGQRFVDQMVDDAYAK